MTPETLLQPVLSVLLYAWFVWRVDALYELLSLWVEVTKAFIKGEFEG